MDSGVCALQYLDVIQMKDSTHKSNFYHNLKPALCNIPKVKKSQTKKRIYPDRKNNVIIIIIVPRLATMMGK